MCGSTWQVRAAKASSQAAAFLCRAVLGSGARAAGSTAMFVAETRCPAARALLGSTLDGSDWNCFVNRACSDERASAIESMPWRREAKASEQRWTTMRPFRRATSARRFPTTRAAAATSPRACTGLCRELRARLRPACRSDTARARPRQSPISCARRALCSHQKLCRRIRATPGACDFEDSNRSARFHLSGTVPAPFGDDRITPRAKP